MEYVQVVEVASIYIIPMGLLTYYVTIWIMEFSTNLPPQATPEGSNMTQSKCDAIYVNSTYEHNTPSNVAFTLFEKNSCMHTTNAGHVS